MAIKIMAQRRAAHAWKAAQQAVFKGKEGGEAVKKVPTMIIENGLLGAMAFALDKGVGYRKTFEELLDYHKSLELQTAVTVEKWFEQLAEGSPEMLRITTAECLAYLSYLRRFVKKDKQNGEEE